MHLLSRLWPPRPEREPPPAAPPRVLFLDDDPARAEHFLAESPNAVWVQTAAACQDRLAERWDEVHLDHDLAGEHFVDSARVDCGMEVVRWICLESRPHLRTARFTVHSHNHKAATLMAVQLMANGFRVEVRPFGAPPPPPLPEEDDPPRSGGLFAAVRAFLGLGRPPLGYGYTEYPRGGPTPDEPPPERPDFGWVAAARRGAPADDPDATAGPPRGGDAAGVALPERDAASYRVSQRRQGRPGPSRGPALGISRQEARR